MFKDPETQTEGNMGVIIGVVAVVLVLVIVGVSLVLILKKQGIIGRCSEPFCMITVCNSG